MLLPSIETPADLRRLTIEQLTELAAEIRAFIVDAVLTTGGHLGSNLGVVELTLALHRVFDPPATSSSWTPATRPTCTSSSPAAATASRPCAGRRPVGLPQPGRVRARLDRESHASTALSYAHGIASASSLGIHGRAQVVAVMGDGALTGGMAYEALNNLGHSGRRS